MSAAPSSSGRKAFNSLIKLGSDKDDILELISCAFLVVGQVVAEDETLKKEFETEKAYIGELINDEWFKCGNEGSGAEK